MAIRWFGNRLGGWLTAVTNSFAKLAKPKAVTQGYGSQRMCPFCGLITPRSKRLCLECGKSLVAVQFERKGAREG
jgi:hypothetical protein